MLNVLSLFDGMSCGQIALNRIGIKPAKYYASELDKYAIKVTQANYPDTIQLGDVTKWREWDIDWSTIDLLIGGSPCQGFSFAGKQLAFDDPRSKLFFVYVDILNHIKSVNPRIKFMLENVKMKKEFLAVISEQLGVEPVFINSSLLSAQNRQRYYWANWEITQPEDKGIVLADILEDAITDREKSYCIDANDHKGASVEQYLAKSRRQLVKCCAQVGRKINPETGKRDDYNPELKAVQRYECREDGKTNCLTTVQKDNLVRTVTFNDRIKGVTEDDRGYRFHKGDKAKSGISELGRILKSSAKYTDALTTSHQPKIKVASAKDKNPEISGDYMHFDPSGKGHKSQCNRVNLPRSKHKSLSGTSGGNKHGVVLDEQEFTYRKLTPVECERLQTVDDNYTNHVSNTQRYKMLGNGWTVDVIAHIFKQGLTA